MHDLIKTMKALSDETRLRILNILLVKECCVCEVMQALNISQTRASRNLSILYNTGFLKMKKEGLWSLYSIDKESMNDFLATSVRAISEALKDNENVLLDRQRLKKARRVGTQCVAKSQGSKHT